MILVAILDIYPLVTIYSMIISGIHLSWLYMPIVFTTGYKWIYMLITCYNLVIYPLVVIQLQTLSEPLPVTNSAPGRLATIAADTGRDLQRRRDSKMGGFSGFRGSLKPVIFHTKKWGYCTPLHPF